MGGVDANLVQLQPVAIDEALEGKREFVRRFETIQGGQWRRIAGAHIGKDDAVALDARIGGVVDFGMKIAALRLGRLFQAFTRLIEQPAVERAAQAAVFEAPVTQVGAAVGAMACDQAIGAIIATVQNQLFAHQRDRHHRSFIRQFLGQRSRLPVMAHKVAAPGAGAGFGYQPVLLSIQHLISIQVIVRARNRIRPKHIC